MYPLASYWARLPCFIKHDGHGSFADRQKVPSAVIVMQFHSIIAESGHTSIKGIHPGRLAGASLLRLSELLLAFTAIDLT